jgi:hypothetical protein
MGDPGRDPSASRNRSATTIQTFDPSADDPLDPAPSVRSPQSTESSQYIVAPSIQVRPEFSSLTRSSDPTQPLTCIVIIELPGKRPTVPTPGPVMSDTYRNGTARPEQSASGNGQNGINGKHTQQYLSDPTDTASKYPASNHERSMRSSPTSMQDQQYLSPMSDQDTSYTTPSIINSHDEDSPFNAITEDLRNRIIDWKGQPLSDLGPLQMYDLLSVRRDSLVREFFVYLFKEAIICVVEEKKRTLGRLLSSASNASSAFSESTYSSSQSKGVLRLKGRIYVRHIKQVKASSAAGEMSLTIDMEDELASFILIFKDRASLESWRNTIQALVTMFQQQSGTARMQLPEQEPNLEEFGGSAKAARMLSGSTGGTTKTTVSNADSILNDSSRSTMSSYTSYGSTASRQIQHKLSTLGEDDEVSNYTSPTSLVTPYMSSGPSNSLTPLPHPPLDLILVISIPPPAAVASTAALKVRVIKTTLDFVMASLNPKDRLSLVTFEVGVGGRVRKTPFLCIGKSQSRSRLSQFVDMIGAKVEEGTSDEFLVRSSKDEKTDVVTAVNHGALQCLTRRFIFLF